MLRSYCALSERDDNGSSCSFCSPDQRIVAAPAGQDDIAVLKRDDIAVLKKFSQEYAQQSFDEKNACINVAQELSSLILLLERARAMAPMADSN